MLSDMNNSRKSKSAEIVKEYMSSLEDLNANSKPHINMLTILAEDDIEYASDIVEAVEAHLQKVRSEVKLPVLYLIDSIVKNVNGSYLNLFTKNIVQTFCDVYEKVDYETREKMLRLRETWNEVFPVKKLFSLDVRVHSINPRWPLPTSAASSKSIIHVNPKFLQNNMQQQSVPVESEKPPAMTEEEMREELLKRQKLLNDLQKQKLKLAKMQQQHQHMERRQIHVKPELIASDGTLKKPLLTSVPCNVSKSLDMELSTVTNATPTIPEKKSTPITLHRSDPRIKTAAALQNGISSTTNSSNNIISSDVAVEEDPRSKVVSASSEASGESSLVSASPVEPRVNVVETGCSETSQTDANADLSLIMNDNKCLDNDRIQRSNSSSQKTAIAVTGVDAQSRNSSERSPSKGSSTRTSSSFCLSSKQPPSNSSSSTNSSSSSASRNRKSSRSSKSHGDSASSTLTSSASSSSSPHKKSSKSRKRSRSPGDHHHHHHHHHHHRHNSPKLPQGLDEEEQFGGSLIVSPLQPSVNSTKDIRDSLQPTKQRRDSSSSGGSTRARRCRGRSSSRSRTPDSGREDSSSKRRDSSSSKDEDLRAALLASTATGSTSMTPLDTKEDLDLRVLPMTSNKRKSTEVLQAPDAKRSKEKKFDDLFGKEDVDLRILSAAPPPQPLLVQSTPSTPPPPIISSDKDNCWAKFKTPTKSDSSSRIETNRNADSSSNRSNRDRFSRNKLYNKPTIESSDTSKDRNRRSGGGGGREYERNADRNIEIIMKQAAEQLNQGTITKSQYNKLIQEVLHMSEDQKLRAAQRKERESKIWDRNDKGMRLKEHGMHPRPPGPRWQQPWHQPWAHPPGPFQPHFRPDFRPIGPWQNHPRLFGGPMRPDFHQFHAGFNPRLAHSPMGPNGPILIPNGPMNPMGAGQMPPLGGSMGPIPPGLLLGPMIPKRPSPNTNDSGISDTSTWSNNSYNTTLDKTNDSEELNTDSGDQLSPADPALLEDIATDTMRSINIDNQPREIRYYGDTGVIFMHWDDPRDIGFQNGARRISIDGKDTVVCSFNDDYREFTYEGEVHRIKLGAPTRELYVDDKWYQCYFGGQAIAVDLGSKKVNVKLDGPPPQVKIGTVKRTDLVVGKINLIINARSMVPVFLDAKPQMFCIEEVPCTLEFIDALQRVLLNGRPFQVEFGGLPMPVLVLEKSNSFKKHFIRFSVLPRGFKAGYVKIKGMKGEQPKNSPPEAASKTQIETTSSTVTAASSPIEPDSTSQDDTDHSYTSKSDLQLDVLSSVVPSAMAPSSGLSYQAEPVENPPVPAPTVTLPLNLNELFQRLVETGIVSNLNETKKPEEEEKKTSEIVPVSFDKPETLKGKQPAMVTSLYSGIQCSSCGARFASEMASRYSHHLDWHFRQNRKERESSRKAHSRLWFYDISDWIQFEEIEDLEDRAQSWFETEKQSMETENAAAEELFTDILQPSVPTGSDEDSCCQVCHEAFEQFYDDEKEEWHLRPAVNHENRNFHPLCLEDHKRTMEQSTTPVDENADNMDKISDIVMDEKKDSENTEENKDKDIELTNNEVSEEFDEAKEASIEIIETIYKTIEEMDLVQSSEESLLEEEKPKTSSEVCEAISESTNEIEPNSETIISKVEIKEETVQIKEEPVELELELEISAANSPAVDSTQVEVKSTIDGNVELESTASTIPVNQSKIKINIIKTLSSSKESKDIKDDKEEIKVEEAEEIFVPLKPVSVKPALQDRNLSVLPSVDKGLELSGLCSIM